MNKKKWHLQNLHYPLLFIYILYLFALPYYEIFNNYWIIRNIFPIKKVILCSKNMATDITRYYECCICIVVLIWQLICPKNETFWCEFKRYYYLFIQNSRFWTQRFILQIFIFLYSYIYNVLHLIIIHT